MQCQFCSFVGESQDDLQLHLTSGCSAITDNSISDDDTIDTVSYTETVKPIPNPVQVVQFHHKHQHEKQTVVDNCLDETTSIHQSNFTLNITKARGKQLNSRGKQ